RAGAAPGAAPPGYTLDGLIYQFDASVQDTLAARSETQATAYQLGRGLAEAYWALNPEAADSWALLLGAERCDELTRLAGRLSGYFNPSCLPAVAGTVRRWQSVASDEAWRKDAQKDLYRQLQRWYDLLVLGQDPSTFIKPSAHITLGRIVLPALRALWV